MLKIETYLCPVCDNKLIHGFCTACMRSFSEEITSNSKLCLTETQIQQQDHVDNACFAFIKSFYPDAEWDQAQISIIRDALIKVGVGYYGDSEYDLHPWLLEPECPERMQERG
jgi:isocitrate dehydrogenase kinase/phosphatase